MQYTNSRSQSPRSLDDLLKQVEDAKSKVSRFGTAPVDNRNWFEKLTNLPKDQNWLFDTLDLAGRPFQAISNAIDNTQKGAPKTTGQALWDGFSGHNKVFGSDILGNAGVTDKYVKGIGGFGLDVALDPTTYVGGAAFKALGKGAKLAGSGAFDAISKYSPKAAEGITDIGDGFRKVFGGKTTRSLDGDLVPDLKNIDTNLRNDMTYHNEKAANDLNHASQIGGQFSGTPVGQIIEQGLTPTDQAAFDIAKSLSPQTKVNRFVDNAFSDMKAEKEIAKVIDENALKADNFAGQFDRQKSIDSWVGQIQKAMDNGKLSPAAISPEISAVRDSLNSLSKIPSLAKFSDEQVLKLVDKLTPEAQEAVAKVAGADPVSIRDMLKAAAMKESMNLRNIKPTAAADLVNEEKFAGNINNFNDVLKQADEVIKNPMPNAAPDLSSAQIEEMANRLNNPNLNQAADMVRNVLRSPHELAAERGIVLPDTYGDAYLPHVATDEAKNIKGITPSSGRSGISGNQAILEREFKMPVADANEQIALKDTKGNPVNMFETNAYLASAEGVKRSINYVLAESAKKQILSNPKLARQVKDGEKVILGKNETVINPNDYDFAKKDFSGKTIKGNSDMYVVTKDVKDFFDRYQKTIQEDGIKNVLSVYDAVSNFWKKTALFSAGFHIRNFFGNNWNMMIAGMNPKDLITYQTKALPEIKMAMKAGEEIRLGKKLEDLPEDMRQAYERHDQFLRNGLREGSLYQQEFMANNPKEALKKKMAENDKTLAQKAKENLNPIKLGNTLLDASHNLGLSVDEMNRFAMFNWSLDKGKSIDEAAGEVKKALFDYKDLSQVEKAVFRRIIPFFSWMRKNIPYQIENFAKQPQKYIGAEKARTEMNKAEGVNNSDIPGYYNESFAAALPGSGDGKGNAKLANLNLPLSDLTKLSDPMRMFTDSLTPLAKVPIEVSSNVNLFNGKPIESFDGEKKPFLGVDTPAKLQYILSQIGALRNAGNRVKDVQDGNWQSLVSGGVVKDQNLEKSKKAKAYDELDNLLAQIKSMKSAKK